MKVFAELFSKSDHKKQSIIAIQSPSVLCALKTSRWKFFGATFFSKKVAKQIQSNILTGSFFKEVREGINGETDYVKVAALDFVYML